MSINESKKSWWQTLPAILSAVAAVLGSLAVLIPVIQANIEVIRPPDVSALETPAEPEDGESGESGENETTDVGAGGSVFVPVLTAVSAPHENAVPAGIGSATVSSLVSTRPTLEPEPEPEPEPELEPDPDPVPDPLLADIDPDPAVQEVVQRPGEVNLRVNTRDSTPNDVVIAFTNTDPQELVRVPDLEEHILQKFTFSGRVGRLFKTYHEQFTTSDTAFLGARYVVVYNEGGNGWDGWLQLAVGPSIVVEERITGDLKNFRRPEMASHRFWWKELNGGV